MRASSAASSGGPTTRIGRPRPDGRHADHVWSADLPSAETAAEAFMATPEAAVMGGMLDADSVTFGHLHIVLSSGATPATAAA